MICLLIALNESAEIIAANEKLCKNELFYCPACKNRVCLKIGRIIRPHFAHYVNEACAVFSEGETREHLEGKLRLANYLKITEKNVQLEAYLPNLQQRPDILFEKDDRKIAVEFQCSSIPVKRIVERTEGYLNANYEVIWILGNHFNYINKLTAFHKACLYFKESDLMLFHYDVETERLSARYDFQVKNNGRIDCQLKGIKLDGTESIKLSNSQKIKAKRNNLKISYKKHKQFMNEIRYPSPKMRVFLELLYQNKENVISMPKELYLYFPSEWMIQNYCMHWKYQFILWLESYNKNKILTLKMLQRWIETKVKAEEISYYASPQLEKNEFLRPFLEFIEHLEEIKVLKKIGQLKWSYQRPLERYKNIEDKFMERS